MNFLQLSVKFIIIIIIIIITEHGFFYAGILPNGIFLTCAKKIGHKLQYGP